MKKSLSIILSVIMAFSAFAVTPFPAFADDYDNQSYLESYAQQAARRATRRA